MKLAVRTFRRNDYVKPSGRSLYGWRIHPVTGKQQFHFGEDYSTKGQNWPVYALEDGVVVASGFDNTNGEHIQIRYPRLGLEAFYAHLHERYALKGRAVHSDFVIGLTGTTGRSTGIHLHMGVRWIRNKQYFNHASYEWYRYAINGIWDEQFTRDLQYYLGTPIDGVISGQRLNRQNVRKVSLGLTGSQMIKKLQLIIGMKQTGQLDKKTILILQVYFGTKQDGMISPRSSLVETIQAKMNNGTLEKVS